MIMKHSYNKSLCSVLIFFNQKNRNYKRIFSCRARVTWRTTTGKTAKLHTKVASANHEYGRLTLATALVSE